MTHLHRGVVLIAALAASPVSAADETLEAYRACYFEFSVARSLIFTLEAHYPEIEGVAALRERFERAHRDFAGAYIAHAFAVGVTPGDELGGYQHVPDEDYAREVTFLKTHHAAGDGAALKARAEEAMTCHPVDGAPS